MGMFANQVWCIDIGGKLCPVCDEELVSNRTCYRDEACEFRSGIMDMVSIANRELCGDPSAIRLRPVIQKGTSTPHGIS